MSSSHRSEEIALKVRASVVQMCSTGRASHVASSLSCVDLLAVLYGGAANVSADIVNDPERDVVIVSKGHAAAALYATLAHCDFFPLDWLTRYCRDGQPLGGHVTSGVIPGVEFSSGSLGHGLPYGCGLTLARKKRQSNSRVFVILSDGECDEGSVWEAALFASHHKLGGLTALIDRNGLQSLTGTEDTLALEPLGDKWRAFGWRVSQVSGHDHVALATALRDRSDDVRPHVIIAETIKGKGVSFMENDVAWHYRPPDEFQLAAAVREILA